MSDQNKSGIREIIDIKNDSSSGKRLFRIVLLAFILLIAFLTFCFFRTCKKQVEPEPAIIQPPEIDTVKVSNEKWGLIIDSFDIINGVIKRNQNLSDILIPFSVDLLDIRAIADSSKKVFDVRKIQSGKSYSILIRKDTPVIVDYFIYESDPVNFVVFKFKDSVAVYKGQHEVDTITREVSGHINSSLWNALIEAGASFELIAEMESVYEWEIDFFHITRGDKFKAIYEEKQIEGKGVGIGRILAANFVHNGLDNYAFFFQQDEQDDYFNEKGQSLRKALLKAPLKYSRISSRFSRSRFHPVLKRYRAHSGVDYAAPTGTPVRAVGNGTVIKAAYSGGAGKYVKIKHNSTYTTGYMHLSRYGKGIKAGVTVKQGDIIGYVGTTGLSTGPHLDYRIWRNGVNINPMTLKLPPAKGIDSAHFEDFNKVKVMFFDKLKKISYPSDTLETKISVFKEE